MSYKPSKCPDCKSDVQMCCCQAWNKSSQSEIYEYEDKWLYQRIEELEKQNTILCEALERIYSPYLTPDYSSSDLRELAGQAIIDVADDETFDRHGEELLLFNTIDLKSAYQEGYIQGITDGGIRDEVQFWKMVQERIEKAYDSVPEILQCWIRTRIQRA